MGWDGANEVTDRLVAMIAEASSSIAITSLYFKPVEPLMALLAARLRVKRAFLAPFKRWM